ncbi:hypothetical protein IWX90DRAFT_392362 [Phyllosticta citrichinensis]|uniref:FK506-binding protein n=1 Tax=Phyllosticta citrichinensis TaxID=1130410 RepID=A0ABR1XHC8_9PEZI
MPLLPVAIYGLEVPAGGMPIQALPDFPATFRITMAAIDPSAEPQGDGPARATLKLIREPITNGEDDSDDEEDDSIDAIRARLGEIISDDESDSDDEKNGGPSDPAKSKKARTEAALKQILEAANEDEMDVDGGAKKNKGKAPAVEGESDEDSEEDDDDDDEEMEMEEFVICTLDADKHYQQAIDITIGEDEQVYFQVTGAYDISLTGNYLVPDHNHDDEDDDEEDEYDLSPDEDELEEEYSEEDDELDGLENPRIKELGSDDEDEEPPKLIEAKNDKGKKRSAESLDEMIKNAGEEKLSKKQQKKLKNNEGKAVGKEEAKDSPADKKKVQFAKNLEQGPTGSPLPKKEAEKSGKDQKTGLGVKQVQGITIDDKKLGTGPAAKKGDRVGMRYIGKLTNGKVFDSNKKGKPFSFKLGGGEVIKGWDIGVAGMTVGSERRITVPAHLAYGKSALPGIPANSTLVFDIKMVSLN